MSKKFRYKNGFEGVVSDNVAAILVKKGMGVIPGQEKQPLSAESRAKIIEKIVKKNLGTAEESKNLSDEELIKLAKGRQ